MLQSKESLNSERNTETTGEVKTQKTTAENY